MSDQGKQEGQLPEQPGAALPDQTVEDGAAGSLDEQAIAALVQKRAAELLGEEEQKPLDNKFVKQCLDANERGDGVLYATLNRNNFRYNVTPRDGEWLVWKGNVWDVDDTRRSFAAVEKCALEYQRAADELNRDIDEQGITAKSIDAWKIALRDKYYKRVSRLRTVGGAGKVLTFAPIVEPSMTCREHDFDKQPWMLPVNNGVIDLRTGGLTSGHPDDMLTRALDIDYDPHADYVPITTYLDEVTGNPEISAFLKRFFGYAITGHAFEQYILVFIGPGRNGKGILFNMIGDVMGPYYHEINRGVLLEQRNEPSPSAASEHKYSLLGKRIIVGAETNKGQKIDAAAVKGLTGEDKITCRPLFKSEISFDPTHTLFLHTNHMPLGLAKDFALIQRLLIVEFPFMYVDDVAAESKKYPRMADKFRQKDPRLKDKLKLCRKGMLRWLVEGCREWQEQGLSPPQSILDGVTELANSEDYTAQFIKACLIYHEDQPKLRLACTTMYDAFEWWWSENMDSKERRTPTKKSINTSLRERGLIVEATGGKTWVYGVTINEDIVEDVDFFIQKRDSKS